MSKHAHVARGFTLIELMVAVAIIGMLSSVAIPSYRNFQLRARQAERSLIVASIVRAIDDMTVREAKFPYDLGGGSSLLYLYQHNPDATPGTSKRPWRVRPLNSLDHWTLLSISIEGGVYHSYYGAAYDYTPSGYRYTMLETFGDLDGDRVQSDFLQYWYWQGNIMVPFGGSNTMCTTARCSYAWEANKNAF